MIDLTIGHETEGDTIHSDVVLHEHSQPIETFPTTSSTEPLGTNLPPPYYSDNLHTTSTIQPMNIQQSLAQPILYPNNFEQMSSQQRAAIANAALINFFSRAGTVSTIMQTVQQTQQQTQQQTNLGVNINDTHLISNEQWEQLSHNPQVIVTGSEEEQGRFKSANATNDTNETDQQNNAKNDQHFIPHIQPPALTSTVTNATPTTTQQDYNRQSYRVPPYYANSLSYPTIRDNRRRRRRPNTHNQNKDKKHKKKDGKN